MAKRIIKEIGFKLNMQIFVDDFEEVFKEVRLINKGNDEGNIVAVRKFRNEQLVDDEVLYVFEADEIDSTVDFVEGSYISIGEPPVRLMESDCRCIVLSGDIDIFDVIDAAQDIFKKNMEWDLKLQTALNNDLGIDELCRISIDYFHNPLFLHDAQFFVLSCPQNVDGMLHWALDEGTGMKICPASLVNDFKIDKEYIATLKTYGAQMFSEKIRGYRILYVNMWDDGNRWMGRLCIDELSSSFKPGQYLAAEYFEKILRIAMRRRNMEPGSNSRPFEKVLGDIIKGNITDTKYIDHCLKLMKWNIDDEYACIKMGVQNRSVEVDVIGVIGTCNNIESNIKGSYAFVYEDDIMVILDLNVSEKSLQDCLTDFAYIIREGLFISGVSDIFKDFTKIPFYYKQACIAYKYGIESGSMYWYHKFEDYALEYIADNACNEMIPQSVCTSALSKLLEYDKKNETELYKTLKVYLRNERNAVHTSKELFIHRSTLFYRIDRIKDLTSIDLDSARTRVYIEMSFIILEK